MTSPKAIQVLKFMGAYEEQIRTPRPTLDEVAIGTSLNTRQTAGYYIQVLIDEGYVRRVEGTGSRKYELTDSGKAALEEKPNDEPAK